MVEAIFNNNNNNNNNNVSVNKDENESVNESVNDDDDVNDDDNDDYYIIKQLNKYFKTIGETKSLKEQIETLNKKIF